MANSYQITPQPSPMQSGTTPFGDCIPSPSCNLQYTGEIKCPTGYIMTSKAVQTNGITVGHCCPLADLLPTVVGGQYMEYNAPQDFGSYISVTSSETFACVYGWDGPPRSTVPTASLQNDPRNARNQLFIQALTITPPIEPPPISDLTTSTVSRSATMTTASTTDSADVTTKLPASTPVTPAPGLSKASRAGIGVGVGVGGFLGLASVLLLFWARRRREQRRAGYTVDGKPELDERPIIQRHLRELDCVRPVHEIGGRSIPMELDAQSVRTSKKVETISRL
ncbi:hypothetical protein BU23DRAFT_570822 [Bimuria novae-zelandiae CBS 107.79]|uniref:Uncharacterized protein n=1 Tax=Bimuria novae-zelandiae CBS 107.79 TaxID=1447943 RepID=A0A6A5V098_9PLEO|nr:hypothetical protein BU23DRAFT_570822 [Bimuria novae-zelandiae CBS 107.79]